MNEAKLKQQLRYTAKRLELVHGVLCTEFENVKRGATVAERIAAMRWDLDWYKRYYNGLLAEAHEKLNEIEKLL